jgi:hypothetical protein
MKCLYVILAHFLWYGVHDTKRKTNHKLTYLYTEALEQANHGRIKCGRRSSLPQVFLVQADLPDNPFLLKAPMQSLDLYP